MLRILCLSALAFLLAAPARAGSPPEEIRIDSLLVLPRVGTSGRSPVFTDSVEYALVSGAWAIPTEGDEVARPDGGKEAWRRIGAGDDGVFRDRSLAAGWAVAIVESPIDRVMLLDARGHRSVYVNGEPRVGDVYDLGTVTVPVALREGSNTLLFRSGRGSLRARLLAAPPIAMLEARDPTLPDAIRGESEPLFAGVIVTNTTTDWLSGLRILATADGCTPVESAIPPIAPLASYKAPVRLPLLATLSADRVEVHLALVGASGEPVSDRVFALRVRDANQKQTRTFVSRIDGSVQYYAVTPPEGEPGAPAALVLTLHGASVEGAGQAAAYEPKPWAYIVAPTNRRPYGFDWEDWGRLDALEVLDLAGARFGADPARTYLTGHSMGGHGTWSLGTFFPGRFAAIAPSAGWRDFWSYAASPEPEPDTAVAAVLWRAANASRTLLMEQNLASMGVYILHGDADDNVPVTQARFMRERLGAFHPNFAYYEQAGAGHWWGNRCVDWPPLFEFLARNRLASPAEQRAIDFVTIDPGISATSGWATIEAQTVAREPSRIIARDTTPGGPIEVTTQNVTAASLDLSARDRPTPPEVRIDGQSVPYEGGVLRIARADDGGWVPGLRDLQHKHPVRNGPFKDAFRHNVLFVVGTAGTPEENAWAMAKARYDAETFWYRGNAAVQITTDRAFGPDTDPDRSVILYGNRDTNTAWDRVLEGSPITIARGQARIGDRTIHGDNLACLLVRPRRGSETASVGIVAGTGLRGLRLTTQLPYFVSGAHYPDWTLLDDTMLNDATGGRAGVVGCGFFAGDWTLGTDWAWRE